MEIYADDIVAERVFRREATDEDNARGRVAAEQQAATRRMTTSRWATTFSFLVPDALSGLLVLAVVNFFASLAGTGVQLSASYLGPVAVLLVGGFAVAGLYHRALTMHPVQEIRVAALVTTVVFFACGTTLWMSGAVGPGALATLGIAWGVAVLVVPFARAMSRLLFAQTEWWGASVLVVASGAAGRAVVHNLRCWPEMGLRPVAVLQEYGGNGTADGAAEEIEGVPVLHEREAGELAPRLMSAYGIPYAIVSRPDLEHRALAHLLRRCSRFCRQVFVMPEMTNAPALWTGPQAFQGFLGYGVRRTDRSLAARAAQFAKRIFDVACALLILLVTAPFTLIISALIKFESSGPLFFRQLRIGRKGRCFSCLKFRSMHVDADQRLEEVLEGDPALRAEYEIYHKLKNDPRVTRLGTFLRQYSLDELPQLWNVLKGDMSLVGPRAYTPSELSDMQDLDRIITQNRPGLSGLWQVSGRNKLSFEERTRLDVHYIHHWSLSMDLYILARTLPVVFEKDNAA